jgi:hypothetical protein
MATWKGIELPTKGSKLPGARGKNKGVRNAHREDLRKEAQIRRDVLQACNELVSEGYMRKFGPNGFVYMNTEQRQDLVLQAMMSKQMDEAGV